MVGNLDREFYFCVCNKINAKHLKNIYVYEGKYLKYFYIGLQSVYCLDQVRNSVRMNQKIEPLFTG